MPELPEVEIVRRGLEPVMAGAVLTSVEQRRPDLRFPFPERFAARLTGTKITAVRRRAKYLLIDTSGGETLIVHLGMSGRLSVQAATSTDTVTLGAYIYDTGAAAAHDHVVFTLSTGARIVYNDPRRFGFMLLCPTTDLAAHPLFIAIGPEPWDQAFDATYLARRAHAKRCDVKSFLLDQKTVAGLGNIYVSEALHRAGLSPLRKAECLARKDGSPSERAHRLVPHIQAVLEAAIRAGGSSLRDYRHTDGSQGGFQNEFAVYGRAGERCRRTGCDGDVVRLVQAQRATFYCKTCQR
jgi:formamidopyrimidine-DNA glycosylase